jgi:DNA-binding FrmR family transcriptional regulator
MSTLILPLFPICYHFHMTKPQDTKALIDRLSRAEGQVRALRHSLGAGEVCDCKEFISQIKAARSALKRTSEQFVLHHINKCQSLPPKEREAQIEEALKVLASD